MDVLGGHVGAGKAVGHVEGLQRVPKGIDIADIIGRRRKPHGLHRLQQSNQQEGVASGADKDMPVGNLRCLAAARINDDQFAAPCLQVLHPVAEIGDGPHAAIGRHWIAAQNDHRLRAVNIGHGPKA